MKKFTTAVQLKNNGTLGKKLSKGKDFEVKEPFMWLLDYEHKQIGHVVVESGFITDFGSIPRILWGIFNPYAYVSYILHDYLYLHKRIIGQDGLPKRVTRLQADNMLFQALRVEKCSLLKCCIIWLGVRCGGWKYWYFG